MSRSSAGPATIIIDTREQEGYSFDPRLAATVRRALPAGDYSVAGLESTVAVERKSLDDFVSTVIHGRERFRNELRKLAGYRAACVVVEAGMLDVKLEVTKKTKGDNENIFFNRRIDNDRAPGKFRQEAGDALVPF